MPASDAVSRKRLFFALWPDAAAREALAAASREFVRDTDGRAVPAEHLHLTVAFLHYVALARLDCVRSAAAGLRWQPFDLTLARIGYWPRSQILWAGPAARVAPLEALFHAVWEALQPCGFTPERRPFRPHVTLARRAAAAPAQAHMRPVPWRVDEFVLVESLTGHGRVRYRVIERFPAPPRQ
jgi:2'-5' RNA ligase